MGRTCRAVSNELYEKAQEKLRELGKNGDIGYKLQAIISVKIHGVTAVANIYGITRATLSSWVKRFEKESSEVFKVKP